MRLQGQSIRNVSLSHAIKHADVAYQDDADGLPNVSSTVQFLEAMQEREEENRLRQQVRRQGRLKTVDVDYAAW